MVPLPLPPEVAGLRPPRTEITPPPEIPGIRASQRPEVRRLTDTLLSGAFATSDERDLIDDLVEGVFADEDLRELT
jgi:hypothetical protein